MDFNEFKPFAKELIAYYYDMPEKGAGGYLHVFLDDGNIDIGTLYWCQEQCEEHKDTFGYFLCDVLLQFKENELQKMYDNNWK
jgi:hypothetical protein